MKQLMVIFASLCSAMGMATNDPLGNISGSVIDHELQQPIPYATVVVNDMQGNLVSGNTSLEDGSFMIDSVPAGTYMLQVQFMGYKTFTQEISLSSANLSLDLGTIAMEPNVAELDGVTVVAQRTTIEQRVDRKVIHVGKDLITTGASAAELMKNIPLVNVDQDGNLSLRGNANVKILIDGRPSNMDPAQLLQQIPSTSIKRIELITNPSAKYNPEGMSGIINIVLHKNAADGFNGNLNTSLTQGEHTRYNGNLDLNYRRGKVNFFGNFGLQQGKNFNMGRIFLTQDNYRQAFDLINHRKSHLFKVGMDLYLDEKNTLSFYTNQNRFEGGPKGEFRLIYPEDPNQDLNQQLDLNFDNTNATYNFVYDHKFEKEQHKLLFEMDYNAFDEDENSFFTFNAPAFPDYQEHVKETREQLTANLDYENPLTEAIKLEMGAEARIQETTNVLMTSNPDLENAGYQYKRDIYSFYTTFSQQLDKWSYQLGSRVEYFEVGADYQGEQVFTDDYLTLYPSGSLTFNPSEKHTYQVSYSRRVDRPGIWQVSPIRQVNIPRLRIMGNPELRPQFTNSIEFNYTRNIEEKGSLGAGIFFRNLNDEINQVFLEDPEEAGSVLLTFENMEDNNSYGLEFSASYKFTKWWSTNSSMEVYSQELKGLVGTEYLEMDNMAFTFRSSHNFKASQRLSLQLFGLYRGKNKNLQMDMKPYYFINLGGRYSFLEDKASISLNFNDIFNTQVFRFDNGRPLPQEGRFRGESRTIFLGLSYRFGGGKNKALQRRQRDDNQSEGGSVF